MLLVHVCYLYGLTNLEGTPVNLLHSHDKAEQRSLARSVRSYDTHNAVWRQREVQVIKKQLVAVCLSHALGLNHLITQTRTVGNEYLKPLLLGLDILIQQLIVRVESGLTLGLTGLGSHTYPLKLTLQCLAALGGLFLLKGQTL
ncbi:MAG: hypothetical protein BWY95_01422 [Bacteroidetes bacterium ADurb.BinA104]|nr:MAG: hypothetical protein BWY95_01422 [Bacteroidetes bacterium ADurb.BinA104]